jgi:3-hydroxyisobutyrate dehydrogenase
MNMANIGCIGMGLMGVPMAKRLAAAGNRVLVWNRTAGRCAEAVAAGCIEVGSIAELAQKSEFVLLCVTNTEAVSQVVLAADGLLSIADAEGKLVIDCSSIDPVVTCELAAMLRQRTGIGWLDAPVSGGVSGAEQGRLAMMMGGELADVERVRDLLSPLYQRLTHMGPIGSGQITKIANQMLVSCNVLVMAEVMALAARAGVDATRIPEALKGGFADSIPLQLTGPRMALEEFEPVKWHVRTLLKDLDMANELARRQGSAVPMAGLGAELMRQHAARGFSEADPATLIRLYRESCGEG